ncbi:unnamed protein product [Paramecium octaurelia]|uniref:Uncharacterized protein n=1 Tax=Paramecium octaurelia TaxID=43137 RepID=A0A8S1V4F0_PAROT|nr:unnamed protein product [Paramecium octaurelia]
MEIQHFPLDFGNFQIHQYRCGTTCPTLVWLDFPSQYGRSMDGFSQPVRPEHGWIFLASTAGAWILYPTAGIRILYPTAGIRMSIRLWDVKTGQQKAKLVGHSSTVNSICYSPDVTTLASGSYDNSIRLWNVKTSKEILQSDSSYKDLLSQFSIPLQNSSLLPNGNVSYYLVNPYCTILRISQNPLFQASGTLIFQGQYMSYQGIDLKPLFKSIGSCFLEDLKQKQK